MTDTDREYISGEGDATDTQRYQAVSRVRSRINEELAKDVRLLERHHSDLLDELREVVCDDGQERPAAMPSAVEPESEPEAEPAVDVQQLVAGFDLGSFGEEEAARREAVVAAVSLLKENGGAPTSRLKETAWEAYNAEARPDMAVSGEVSLWGNIVLNKGLKRLDVVEDATKHERQGGYVWVGHE